MQSSSKVPTVIGYYTQGVYIMQYTWCDTGAHAIGHMFILVGTMCRAGRDHARAKGPEAVHGEALPERTNLIYGPW